jgi:hypothetical protein
MRLLELFCGTKSVSNAVRPEYDEIISLDILPKFAPSVCANILEWDYRVYPPGHFDAVWASPPCTQYSKAKTRGVRDIEGANAIVLRTIEIIQYFNPAKWFIENPDTGKLKEQEFMDALPYAVFDYCRFGYLYRKRTRFWTNMPRESRLCLGVGECPGMIGTRHRNSCGNGNTEYADARVSLHDKYSIPEPLVRFLFFGV